VPHVSRIDPSQEKDLDRAIQTAFKTFAAASNETGTNIYPALVCTARPRPIHRNQRLLS
jgi:hypothetical protein